MITSIQSLTVLYINADFGAVIANLRKGNKAWRSGWNGKSQYLELQVPDEHSKMTQPYIYINIIRFSTDAPKTDRIPWLASQADILAEDWVIAK